MNFLFANAHELAALLELPYIQRVVYLMGIRPYMDRQSCIVGIKRRISYQSLRETLYVGPIAGVKTGSPSLQQERAGLIEIQSTERHLILKCIYAELDNPAPKKAVPKPNHNPDTGKCCRNREIMCIKTKTRHSQ
ncbi:protein LvrA [Legionella pneumophila]|uniref:protein LvrA n=1 Tax=Legionella pneumophila TaxID=446 RepID=UPI001F411638|nr:protein LvrA [Legionella pneumophila]